MRRVPSVDGVARDAHAHLQFCGRPVADDGLCAFHLRHRDVVPGAESRFRRALKALRR